MIRVAQRIASAIHLLSRVVGVVAIIAMLFIMLVVVYSVVLREANQPPIRGIVEFVEFGMAMTAFLSLGEAERRRQHVSVDEILQRAKGPLYVALRIFGAVGGAAIACLLAVAAFHVLMDSIARGEYRTGLIKLPMWPPRLAVFVGFTVLALEQLVSATEDLVQYRRKQTVGA